MADSRELQLILTLKDQASKNMQKVGAVVSSSLKATAVAASGATLAVGAFAIASIKSFAQLGDEVAKMSIKTGATAEDLSALKHAADLSNVSFDQLGAALKRMNLSFGEARNGNEQVIGSLNRLGLTMAELSKLNTADQFTIIAEKITGLPSIIDQTTVAMDIFGKAGVDLLPLLTSDIAAARKEAEALGLVFDDKAAKAAEDFNDSITRLQGAFNGIKVAIGSAALEPLSKFAEELQKNIVKVKEWIDSVGGIQGVKQIVIDSFNDIIQKIDETTGIVTILKTAWDNIVLVFDQSLRPAIERLWEALQPLKPFLVEFGKIVGVILYGALLAVVKIIEISLLAVMGTLTAAINLATGALDLFVKGWEWLTDQLSKVIDVIDRTIAKVKQLASATGITGAVKSFLGFGGGKATGGPVRAGTGYIVGENGPEFFTPQTNGSIIPNHKLSSGSVVVNVTINGDVSGQELIDKVQRGIMDSLRLNMKIA